MSIQSYPINYPNYLTYQDTSNNFIVGPIQSYPNNDVIFTDTNSILRNPLQNQPEFASPNYNRYQRLSLPSSNQHDALSNIYGFNQIGYDSNFNLIKVKNYNDNGYSSKNHPSFFNPKTNILASRPKTKKNVSNINSIKVQNYNDNGYSSKNDPSFINPTTNIGKYGPKIKNNVANIKQNTYTNNNDLFNYPYTNISNNINYNSDNIDQYSNITSETGSKINYNPYFNIPNQTVEDNYEDYFKYFTNNESNTNTQNDIYNINNEYLIDNYGQNNNNFSNQITISNNNNIQIDQNQESVVNNDNINNNNINTTYNNNSNQISIVPIKFNKSQELFQLPNKYYFHKIGLQNIGSTCYMNATLQCLLHVNTLFSYFRNKYHLEIENLQKLNDSVPTKGKISLAFFEIINSICKAENNKLVIITAHQLQILAI